MREVKFGTDGIRARAMRWPITKEVGRAIGATLLELYKGSRILVGRDTRTSSPELAQAVLEGAGQWAVDGGVIGTPLLALALFEGIAEVGVMVTASHNADADNGFKIFGQNGNKLSQQETARFESALNRWLQNAPPKSSFTASMVEEEVRGLWLNTLQSRTAVRDAPAGVLDLANGAMSPLAPWFKELGWVIIGDQGEINHQVGSQHLTALCEAVVQHKAPIGIAVDGDGDRCRIVDELGNPVHGDAVTWFLAKHLNLNALAITVMSTGSMENLLKGAQITRTPVGDKHLLSAMQEKNITLGAEESGHILFADYPGNKTIIGDGLFSGFRFYDAINAQKQPVSQCLEGFLLLPRATGKIKVGRRPTLSSLPKLTAAQSSLKPHLGLSGRIFLRYSGTEPVLRLLVEGESQQVCDDTLAALVEVCVEELS